MKTGLGLFRKWRLIYAFYNLFRFILRKKLIGFDVANQFIQRVDKHSLQLILKKNGATIGKDCDIETGLIFHNCTNYSNFSVGDNCHIGKNCFFDLRDKIIIGNNVVISMQSCFITHIDVSYSRWIKKYPKDKKEITIKNNTYIGAKSTLLMGVICEECSFISAGSLVRKSVNQNTIVAGVPAKPIISSL